MKARILIVDDETAIQEVISSMLTSGGYECGIASSGNNALAVLNSGEEFHLIVSNLMMADLDGLGLCERMRTGFPDIPFIVSTAVHDGSVMEAAYRMGVFDYLLKPFLRPQLLGAVSRALEYRRLKLENRAYQEKIATLEKGNAAKSGQ